MRTSWSRFAALLLLIGPSVSLIHTPSNPPPSSGSSGVPAAPDPTITYLADLLGDTREELTRADSKAALLLSATGVAVGALLAGLLAGKWTPFELDNRVEWIWWVGVGSAAAGIYSIAAAIYPRIHRRSSDQARPPAYYGDVAGYEKIELFRQAVDQAVDLRERLIDQTFQVSHIVQRKYVLLQRGLRFLLLAIVACAAAVLINIPLRP
jgi:hypothetical protein